MISKDTHLVFSICYTAKIILKSLRKLSDARKTANGTTYISETITPAGT